MEIGGYHIKARFIIIVVVLMFAAFLALSGLLGDKAAPDASPGRLEPYHYPFENAREQSRFEAEAVTVENGAAIHNAYPDSLGARLRFRVYLPEGATSRENSFVFTRDGFIYYPAIVVSSDVRALTDVREQFEGASGDPTAAWLANQPVMLGFREAAGPPETARFLEVLGTFYWSNVRLDDDKPDGVPDIPAVVVGAFDVLREAQVVDPATATVPVDFSFRRGNLTVEVDRVEFSPGSTRVHVNMTNDATIDASWPFNVPQTFVSADNRQYRLVAEDGGEDENADRVAEAVPPKQSDGYLFFERTGVPARLEIYLADPSGNGTIRHTVDMRRLLERKDDEKSL